MRTLCVSARQVTALRVRPGLKWLIAAALALYLGGTAGAQTTYTWNANNGWGNATSWTPAGGPPGAADTAILGGAATGTISFGGGTFTVGTLNHTGGDYTLDTFPATGAGTYGTLNLTTLNQGAGALTINTRLVAPAAFVGTITGGSVTLNNDRTPNTPAQIGAFPPVPLPWGGPGQPNTFPAGSSFVVNGGTLNVSLNGTINPDQFNALPTPIGSSALGSASLTLGGGTVNLTGRTLPGANGGYGLTAVQYSASNATNTSVTPTWPGGNITPAWVGGTGSTANFAAINLNNQDPNLNDRTRRNALFNTWTAEPMHSASTNAGYNAAIINPQQASVGAALNTFEGSGMMSPINYYVRFTGLLTVSAAGDYTFGTRSDDGSNVFINGVRVVNNNFYQGMTTRVGTVNLAAGTHLIEVDYYQGGGGNGMMLGYQGPDNPGSGGTLGTGTGDGDFVQFFIPGSRLTAVQARATLGNNVTVTANSTLNANNAMEVVMGNLTMNPGTTLTTNANGGTPGQNVGANGLGAIRFNQTTLVSGGNATYTVNTAGRGDLSLGTLFNQNNGVATIVKQGSQNLILDSLTAPTVGGGFLLDIQGGRVEVFMNSSITEAAAVSRSPLQTNDGAAVTTNTPLTVQFSGTAGAGQALEIRTRNSNISGTASGGWMRTVPIVVNTDGAIEVASTTATSRTIEFGGSTGVGMSGPAGITLANNATLTFDHLNGNMVSTVVGPITGTGNIRLTGANNGGAVNTLNLNNNTNNFVGEVRAVNGIIQGNSANSFGAAGNALFAQAGTATPGGGTGPGGAISLNGTFTLSQNVTIAGNGPGGNGALRAQGGSPTFNGSINITGSTAIGNTSTGNFTVNPTITLGANNLTLPVTNAAGTLTLAGAVTGTTSNLTKNGPGTATLSAPLTLTGTTTVNDGTLNLNAASSIGAVTVNGGTLNLTANNTVAGATTINSGTVRVTAPTGLGASNVTANGPNSVLRFDAGAGNTAGGTGATVTLNQGSQVQVLTGTANLSNATIALGSSAFTSGLLEIASNTTTRPRNIAVGGAIPGTPIVNPTGSNTPGVRMGHISQVINPPNYAQAWSDNNLWVYTGQIQATGNFLSFAENIDDDVWIRVNGVTIVDDQQWNVPVKGTIPTTPGQWYDIEIRLWNGGGGAGPVTGSGWVNNGANVGYGFGIADVDTGTNTNGSAYFKPGEAASGGGAGDPLGSNRFRTGTAAGAISVAAGSSLQIKQVTGGNGAAVTINGAAGNPGVFQLVNQGSATASTLDAVNLFGTNPAGRLVIGQNQTLTVQQVNVAAGGTLNQAGEGRLVVNGASAAGNTGTLRIEALPGELPGTLSGTGTLGGSLIAAQGAKVAPGNASRVGNLTVQGNTSFLSGSALDIGLPSSGASAPNASGRLVTTGQLIGDGGTIQIRLFGTATAGYTPGTPVTFVVATHASTTGTLPNVVVDPSGYTSGIATISHFSATGAINAGDIQVTLTPVPVPEPGAILLMAAGAMGAAGFVRRRLKRQAATA
jgi:fibronectin-binding autotransporter adhesin